MKTQLTLMTLAGGLLLAGCQSHPQSREFTLTLTSAMPVSFAGNLRVDGRDQAISGMTPAEYRVTGQQIQWEVRQGPENGLLTAQVRIGENTDALALVTASTGPNTEARGVIRRDHGWSWTW